ncbi:putative uncharacterized protein MSANTD5 [Phodopus roborovskii]|uniref:putative uncharacterized protein MSANTD5 n=1 Tax=Phodopus roborovskii TaxID=109678 RepID=UPI0021E37FB0|nr:putative uncharacterized protein MSANTD5 [Phodopus roborovskii]
MEQSVQQQGPTLSGPSRSRWTDPDIRIFLQEWEVVEAEIGHPGRKIHKKTRALCQGLFHRGLKKSWQSCFDLLVSLQYLHRKLCSERPRTEPLFSPYAEALYRILGHRPQGSYFPGPSRSRWTDPDIRIFLQEWEVVEAEIGHPGRKIHKKTRALCQRLFHRGLKKSWQSCFDLLVSLQYLHRKLCSERPRTEPLFSPYAEALYRILGHRPQGSYFPGPPKYGAGYPLYPMDPQLPMVIPSAPYQPCHYGFPAPSPRLQGYQWSMMSCGHSGHPAFLFGCTTPSCSRPRDSSVNQQCLTPDDTQGPQGIQWRLLCFL